MTNTDWTIEPQTDETGHLYYGVKQDDYSLYIASGCCGAILQKWDAIGSEARCSNCDRIFHISPFESLEDTTPFKMYWGMFTWADVEGKMLTWIDFYFNLKSRGDVEIFYDGQTWMDHTT